MQRSGHERILVGDRRVLLDADGGAEAPVADGRVGTIERAVRGVLHVVVFEREVARRFVDDDFERRAVGVVRCAIVMQLRVVLDDELAVRRGAERGVVDLSRVGRVEVVPQRNQRRQRVQVVHCARQRGVEVRDPRPRRTHVDRAVVADRQHVRCRAVERERERHGDVGVAVVGQVQRRARCRDVDEVGRAGVVVAVAQRAVLRRPGRRHGAVVGRSRGDVAVELDAAAIGQVFTRQREQRAAERVGEHLVAEVDTGMVGDCVAEVDLVTDDDAEVRRGAALRRIAVVERERQREFEVRTAAARGAENLESEITAGKGGDAGSERGPIGAGRIRGVEAAGIAPGAFGPGRGRGLQPVERPVCVADAVDEGDGDPVGAGVEIARRVQREAGQRRVGVVHARVVRRRERRTDRRRARQSAVIRVDVDVCRFGDFRRVEVERQDTETGDGPAADTDDEIVCGIRAGSREFTAAAGRATAAVGRAVDCRSSVRSQRSCLIVEYGACAAIAVSDAVVGERDAASRRVAHLRIVACGFFRLRVSVNLCDFCFRAAGLWSIVSLGRIGVVGVRV